MSRLGRTRNIQDVQLDAQKVESLTIQKKSPTQSYLQERFSNVTHLNF